MFLCLHTRGCLPTRSLNTSSCGSPRSPELWFRHAAPLLLPKGPAITPAPVPSQEMQYKPSAAGFVCRPHPFSERHSHLQAHMPHAIKARRCACVAKTTQVLKCPTREAFGINRMLPVSTAYRSYKEQTLRFTISFKQEGRKCPCPLSAYPFQ